MRNIKKVLVGLDLSPFDEVLIKKTVKLARRYDFEMVYFVHVAKNLALPDEVKTSYPDLMVPVDETIEKEITDKVLAAGFPEGLGYEINVKEGGPMEQILRWSNVKDVDLIIMGRKHDLQGSGTLAKRIALQSPCSVLFLTENMPDKDFQKIIVPIDFSSYSVLALDYAQQISPDPDSITCYHLYEVPSGYTKIGKSYEEFAKIMRENSEKEYAQFVRKHNLPGYDIRMVIRNKDNKAESILDAAKEDGMDLIVIGSRGRSNSAAMLVGSFAEKLINSNNEIPMLVMKKKGENMRFLEALFRV